MGLQRAQAAWRETAAWPRAALHPAPGRRPQSAPPHDRGEAAPRVRVNVRLARQRVHPRHRRRENGPSGSVRGAPGHRRPYRGALTKNIYILRAMRAIPETDWKQLRALKTRALNDACARILDAVAQIVQNREG